MDKNDCYSTDFLQDSCIVRSYRARLMISGQGDRKNRKTYYLRLLAIKNIHLFFSSTNLLQIEYQNRYGKTYVAEGFFVLF